MSELRQLALFADAAASREAGKAALTEAAAKHEDLITALVPLARELAEKVGAGGITVSDLRIIAVQREVLTGAERGRELSFLGAVMPRAGLVATGDYRRSSVVKSHGNLQMTWVLPEHQRRSA